jgi:Domain of unknown function (DUF4159)
MRSALRYVPAAALAVFALTVIGAATTSVVDDVPRPFREYPSFEGEDAAAPLPADWNVPGELVIGRLMYPSAGRGFFGGGNWREGGTGWTDDYPRGDRALIQMLRRFTRANVRAVEQPVSLDDGDDVYYYPFLISGLAWSWSLTDEQAAKLREYLLRGGFLFCDSFYGGQNWEYFAEGLHRMFPEREIVDLKDDEVVFHVAFDLKNMTTTQIPNMNSLMGGGSGYLSGGSVPRWRGVFDDQGRLMVLIAFNNDVADAWQWADDPRYPADEANKALRIGADIAIYAMSH